MPSPNSSLLTAHSFLITGGAGFIGCNLIKRLLAEGAQHIRILDNLSVGTRSDLARICRFIEVHPESLSPQPSVLSPQSLNDHVPTVELIVGDIRDPQTCDKATKNIKVIIHLAANTGVAPSVETPRLDMEANVIGTLNMLEAARENGVKRFIFASSGAPVGECTPPIHEELAPHPVSPYGASKLAGEGYCSAYHRTFGLETVSLRFGNVYGPLSSHKSSVVAKFIRQALAGEACEIYGDGTQTRDFIYIADLIEAIIKAAAVNSLSPQSSALSPESTEASALSFELSASSSPWGEVFQIATNREHTVNEVAAMLAGELKRRHIAMRIHHGSARLGDVRRNYADTTKACKMLGWKAEVILAEGLRRTVEWFLNDFKDQLPEEAPLLRIDGSAF